MKCKCGCNCEIIPQSHHKWYGVPKYIPGHQNKGKHLSEEHRKNISDAKLGKPRSEETKKKISLANSGENNPNFGRTGEKHPMYIDGKCEERQKLRRRKLLNPNPEYLNERFESSHGHHINRNMIMFIPVELHQSVPGHSVIKNKKMDIINRKVMDWFEKQYNNKGEICQTIKIIQQEN